MKTTLPIYENLSKALQVTSRAKILRIEICNPGLPPSLTGFTTSTKINAKGEFVLRRRIFTPEHDKAVRKMLGVVNKSQCTFDKYILPYVLLKARYVRSVSGYGSFILVDDLPQFISDATEIKNEFDDLRQKVRNFLKDELKAYGPKVLLNYGSGSVKRNGIYDQVVAILQEAGKTIVENPGVMTNPTLEKLNEGVKIARENDVDLILALGGGSVCDYSKAVAASVF